MVVAGALLQSLARNPLGSPDIIGFTTGAATAATLHIVVFDSRPWPVACAAMIGGVVTAIAVYGLTRRDGITGGLRLVLVGIGMGALLGALTDFIMVRARVADAALVQQ